MHILKIFAIGIFLSVFFPTGILSETLYVPADHATIQGALNAASDGDTIIVSSGTYNEIIDFLGKAVTLKSEEGPQATCIDGNDLGCVVSFEHDEGPDSVLKGFTIRNGLHNYGGGIRCEYSDPTLIHNIIKENRAYYGGGGLHSSFSDLTLINNVFQDNKAGRGAGAVVSGHLPTLEGNIFTLNTATGTGGGIDLSNCSADAVISNNWITDNTAADAGGGLDIAGAHPKFRNNVISGNSADEGGGIYANICIATFEDNVIENNTAVAGGGVYLLNHSRPVFRENRLTGNSAEDGGAFYFNNAYPKPVTWQFISNNVICGNTVTGRGGAVYSEDSNPVFLNNIFHDNTADQGGAFYAIASEFTSTNNTFFMNAAAEGGCMYIGAQSSPVVVNSILWNDQAPTGKEIHEAGGTPLVTYCNVEQGWPGTGNIDADPLFADPSDGDLHLLYGSPCKDQGDNAAVKIPAEDCEGDPRIAFGIADMGADEFFQHLYYTGDATPGGSIKGKIVGLPGTAPVGLLAGSGIVDPPLATAWGNFYLAPPWFLWPLVPIPAEGLLELPPATIPPATPTPLDLPLQALVGLNPDSLTNLCVVEIR
ncbi:MAG: right-handed parallel beta-helix repeat-containing protein [Planctomycetota bacterium]